MQQNGTVHGTYRNVGRMSPCTGISFGTLEDCYAAAKALYTGRLILPADSDRITIIGDDAGGNLAAAVCLLAKENVEVYAEADSDLSGIE